MKIKERVVVFPDIHFPNHDEDAFKCALNVIREMKPTAFLLIGDVIDGASVSHWQWAKKKRPPLEYQLPAIDKEIAQGNEGLDRIDEALNAVKCKKKQFAQGNHELWFDHLSWWSLFRHCSCKNACFANGLQHNLWTHT